jgi:tRNA-dihydrouridine synthase B
MTVPTASRLPWFGSSRPPLYLAPMARHTDHAFRGLCKEHGADVMVTEFVQSEALLRDNAKAWEMVDFSPGQRPMGVQIFGATPASMAKAARLVCDRMAPDFLDLNFGCPAHKVIEQSAGAGLLRCTPLLFDIVKAVRDAIPETPLTAKMRLGWDEGSIVAVEVAGRLEALGVEALAVHGRTRAQGYSGRADWDWIGRVAAAVRIPVIGNGDLSDPLEAVGRLTRHGVRGLMVGRAALASPWVFGRIRSALGGEPQPPPPTPAERWSLLIRLAELTLERAAAGAGQRDVRWMFSKLHPLTHGLPGCRKVRLALQSCHSLEALKALAADHLKSLSKIDISN